MNKSFLNVGIFVYISMIILFFITYDSGIIPTIAMLLLGYFGAVVGNIIRIYAMPDVYFTNGTLLDGIKKRFFWSHGPQLIGFFLILFFMSKRIESWF
ncbi:hypothetical protein ABE179_07200 [Aliarcobacter skirrowii]|uniref:hypothetical protein n=1 Tax=Aliarcobacter skirrowii TaxID=28200 RepID=UPI00320A6508